MATQQALDVLVAVGRLLRTAQRDAADRGDLGLAQGFGMSAGRCEDLTAANGRRPPELMPLRTEPLQAAVAAWTLLRTEPLADYPPGVGVLALWLVDLIGTAGRRSRASGTRPVAGGLAHGESIRQAGPPRLGPRLVAGGRVPALVAGHRRGHVLVV